MLTKLRTSWRDLAERSVRTFLATYLAAWIALGATSLETLIRWDSFDLAAVATIITAATWLGVSPRQTPPT